MEALKEVLDLFASFLIPALAILITAGLGFVKNKIDQVSDSTIIKNDKEGVNATASATSEAVLQLTYIVKAAVAANMKLVSELKGLNGGALTPDNVEEVLSVAKTLIESMLPSTLREGGALFKLIGGKEVINSMIDNIIEEKVIEVKSDLSMIEI